MQLVCDIILHIHTLRFKTTALLTLVLLAPQSPASTIATIRHINSIPENARIIDVRVEGECRKRALATATCLPIEEVMASRQRLANFSGLLWKLGTVGLTGAEHVLVAGNSTFRKDVMAGILHLAGQQQISILAPSLSDLNANAAGSDFAKGNIPPSTRIQVWQSPMRSQQIVLHNEMTQLVLGNQALILDGRPDTEYWGKIIRAHRGGHIPGADSSSYSHWLPSSTDQKHPHKPVPVDNDQSIVVYAADTYSSIAYYARLVAAGLHARVYLDGWLRWAAQTELPIDAASYSGNISSLEATSSSPPDKPEQPLRQHFSLDRISLFLWVFSVAIAFVCGYIVCRFSKGKLTRETSS